MTKKVQFILLFIGAFIERHKKHLILGLLFGFLTTLLLLQIYPYYSEAINPRQKKIGIAGRFNENNLPLSIQNKISLGLTTLLPSTEATSSLAHSWRIASDGLTYTFNLLDNVYWHNGNRLVAKDISYRLKDVNFTPISDSVLKITLKEPYSPLLTNLSAPLLKPGLIGLGIYKVSRIIYSGDYISELMLSSLKKGLPPLLYKFYPNADDAILAFKLGEVNILENIAKLSDLKEWKEVKIAELSLYDRIVAVFLNLKNPHFKEKDIRHALNYAIPPFEGLEKAYTSISPLSWGYSNKIRLYKYDPETAKKILSKSILASPSSEITISTYVSLLSTAQMVADAWTKAGVKSKVKVETSILPDYQAFVLTFVIPPDPDQYQFWQSTQEGMNITHYSNLKIDKLLEDGRKTQDRETRKKIYADFQRYLVDDSPVIFLYYPKVYTVERK